MPLSRAHRPQRFSEVTGQQHITETLRRELAQQMIGHAYVFSGPRGVGKTTSARIFAKGLLCEKLDQGEPCNTCSACREVMDGRCIDLIEMDAASHNGVEHVRESIIEHVRFAPVRWKYKVYVLDEAHMITGAAWNALLKTLEEPPPYAVFILATTELSKIPATIVSRCQRFEFKRVSAADMDARIRTLSKEEGLTLDDDVVAAIVAHADGYVRDAESLLEQLASLGENKITTEIAELILPVSRLPAACALLDACSHGHAGKTLQALHARIDEGIPPIQLFDDLLAVVRMLIRTEDPAEAVLLTKGDEGHQAAHALMGRFHLRQLSDIALLLIDRRRDAKSGVNPVFALELAMAAICVLHHAQTETINGGVPQTRQAMQPSATPVSAQRTIETAQKKTADDPVIPSVQTKEAVAQQPATAPAGALEVHDILIRWQEVIRCVEQENRSLPFILKVCRPESVRGSVVVIQFQYPFHREKVIDELKNKRIVENALRQILGRDNLIIDGVVGDTLGQADRATTAGIVSKVLTAFGGTVVE